MGTGNGKRNSGQRRAGRYRAQPVDPVTGKRRSISATTQAELDSRLRRLRDVKDGVKYGDIDAREAGAALRPALGIGLRVRDCWNRYMPGVSVASAPKAACHWKYRLEPHFGDRMAIELDAATMRIWEQRLLDDYAPKTISGAYECLAKAVGLQVDAGAIAFVPWRAWRPATSKNPQTPREAARNVEELVAILAAGKAADQPLWDAGRYSARFYATLWLGLTGMRQAEAAGLSWDNVEIDAEPYYVRVVAQAPKGWRSRQRGSSLRPAIPPKGKSERSHTLHVSAALVLRHQREQLKRFDWYRYEGPVFPGVAGEWRGNGAVLKPDFFRQVVRAAGLPNVERWSPHSLRHSVATLEAVASGGDLRAVQARTGHTDLRILEGYLHRAGRGMAPSRIPELPAQLTHPQDGVLDSPESEPKDPVSHMLDVSHQAATDYQESVDETKRAERKEAQRPFVELAREWLLAGRKGVRPKAVTAAVRRAYVRAYQAEFYRSHDREQAKEAGYRSRRAALGAWGKALKAAERALAKTRG